MYDTEITKVLCDLIALDHDAIDAYSQAIRRLKSDEQARGQLAVFKGDHERHVRDLIPLVQQLGGTPPSGGDFMRFITQGKVVLLSMMGDVGILRAMRSNEDTTNQKYEQALRTPGLTYEIRTVLERNLGDERRHRAWLESRLAGQRAGAAA